MHARHVRTHISTCTHKSMVVYIHVEETHSEKTLCVCERWHVIHAEGQLLLNYAPISYLGSYMISVQGRCTTHAIPRRAGRQCYDRKSLVCLPTRDRCPCKSFPRSRFPSHIPINPATYQQTIFIITFAFFPGKIQCLEACHTSIFSQHN